MKRVLYLLYPFLILFLVLSWEMFLNFISKIQYLVILSKVFVKSRCNVRRASDLVWPWKIETNLIWYLIFNIILLILIRNVRRISAALAEAWIIRIVHGLGSVLKCWRQSRRAPNLSFSYQTLVVANWYSPSTPHTYHIGLLVTLSFEMTSARPSYAGGCHGSSKVFGLGQRCVALAAFITVFSTMIFAATFRTDRYSLVDKIMNKAYGPDCPNPNCACGSKINPILTNRTRMHEVVAEFRHDLTYVYPIDTVFTTMAKSGSSTTWRMIFMGLTGRSWNKVECGNPQNKLSPCWRPYLSRVKYLPEEEQFRVLTSNKTLRVAIQREPFPRLVSAFKNKLACDAKMYNTVPSGDHARLLRVHAMMTPGPRCMNVSEYADTLDRIRKNAGKSGFVSDVRWIDGHFRPQNFFADSIRYDLILDVADLSNYTRLSPFLDRLPYAEVVRNASLHMLDSGSAPLLMDDLAARKLHDFAKLSIVETPRYILWFVAYFHFNLLE